MGVLFTVLATLVCLFNFWRYQMRLYYLRHGEGGGDTPPAPRDLRPWPRRVRGIAGSSMLLNYVPFNLLKV